MNDRDKLLDRVRKCLALSKSSNEHEAAAALRQAQKIMAAHGIDEDEVGLALYASDFVDHDDYEYGLKKPMLITCVIDLMQRAFGVSAVWEKSPDNKHRIRYFGEKSGVMLAVHSHTVVYRAVNASWRRHLKDNPHLKGVRDARASFARGWCAAVVGKIQDLSPSGDKAAAIKKKKEQQYGQSLSSAEIGTKSVFRSLIEDGARAGAEFSINRPVGSDRRYLGYQS